MSCRNEITLITMMIIMIMVLMMMITSSSSLSTTKRHIVIRKYTHSKPITSSLSFSSPSVTTDDSSNINIETSNNNNKNDDETRSLLPPWLPSFSTAALGGLLFGGDIGGSSSVVRILGQGTSELGKLDAIQLGTIASTSLLGAMIASFTLIILGDKQIGRQLELRIAAVLFTIGTIIQSFSPSLGIVLVGRLIYGLGIGTAMHVAPLYIAETAPNNLRGTLVSLKEAAIVGGIVVGYLAGSVFGTEGEWRKVFESFLPLEAMMLAGSLIVPESPRWLSLRGLVIFVRYYYYY